MEHEQEQDEKMDFLQFDDLMSPSVSDEVVPEELGASPSRNDTIQEAPQLGADPSRDDTFQEVQLGADPSRDDTDPVDLRADPSRPGTIQSPETDEFGRLKRPGSESDSDRGSESDSAIPKRRTPKRNSSLSPRRRSRSISPESRQADPRRGFRHRHESYQGRSSRDDCRDGDKHKTNQRKNKFHSEQKKQQLQQLQQQSQQLQQLQQLQQPQQQPTTLGPTPEQFPSFANQMQTQTVQYPQPVPNFDVFLRENMPAPKTNSFELLHPGSDNYLMQNLAPPPPPSVPPPAWANATTTAAVNGNGAIEHEVELEGEQEEDKATRDKHSKLVRVAITDYVKEALKPAWKGGHLSKEAYKTIVKKSVDKVTSTLKSHQIPRTQDKVDHFMSFSRQKISKLVQGYVEKYQKPSSS